MPKEVKFGKSLICLSNFSKFFIAMALQEMKSTEISHKCQISFHRIKPLGLDNYDAKYELKPASASGNRWGRHF